MAVLVFGRSYQGRCVDKYGNAAVVGRTDDGSISHDKGGNDVDETNAGNTLDLRHS